MTKRINIILPASTVSLLDRVATKGHRSSFIDRAVNHYIRTRSRKNLKDRLKEGYRAEAEFNAKLAEEWFPLEEEAWQSTASKRRRK